MSTNWFQFDDGGSYVGEVDSIGGTAHGFGVAKGPDGRAEYAGSWKHGFEESGSFKSSSGSDRYEGQWAEGKRNGLGVERRAGWIYRGEWTDGLKGRYGIRQSSLSSAKYEGTWASGLQDGYGVETSADGGTYQGQWSKGLRHGYGIRQSVTYEQALATHQSFKSRSDASQPRSTDFEAKNAGARVVIGRNTELELILRRHDRKIESGGGFVLTKDVAVAGSHLRFGHLLDRLGIRRISRRRSFSGIPPQEGAAWQEDPRSQQTQSTRPSQEVLNVEAPGVRAVKVEDDELSLCDRKEVLEGGLIERYLGEWKGDARVGYGVGHRSDGLQYEGEWLNDKKNGYGRTTLADGSRIDGKYKNNALVSAAGKAGKGPKIFTDALQEKVEFSVTEAQKAAENAKQKADIALIRVPSAQVKAEEADVAANEASRHEQAAQYSASQSNQLNAKPGNLLTMHRINEDEFLVAYDTGERTPAAGAFKQPTGSLSSLRLRLPFKRSKQQHPGLGFASGKPVAPKRFPWQKMKMTGTRKDEGVGMGKGETGVAGGHHGDQFHLQQPIVLGMDRGGGRDIGPEEGAHYGYGPATGGGLHFESRVTEKMVVHQLHSSTTLVRPGLDWRGGVGRVGGVGDGRQGRCDRLRKELIEAVEPSDARHPRRNSLPCIVKEKIFDSSTQPTHTPSPSAIKPLLTHKTEDAGKMKTLYVPPKSSAPSLRRPSYTETYLIDKGVRKRVKSLYEDVEHVQRSPSTRQAPQKSPSFRSPTPGAMGKLIMSTMVTGFALSQATPLRDWTHDSTTFHKMYAFESPTLGRRKTKTGSTSDVSAIKPSEVMSREVVYVMSQRRREELIRRRAEEEARRMRGEIVISIYMFQDWRVLLVLLFLLVIAGLVVLLKDSNQS